MSSTGLVFLLFFLTGLGLTLFVRPMYGLYTYCAVFYVHPPSRWWGATLPDLRWSLLAALITFIALLIHRHPSSIKSPWYSSRILVLFTIYAVWMWLQVPWVLSPYQVQGAVLFAKYVILLALIYTIVDNEKDLLGFCLAHAIGCGYLGLLVYLAPDAGRLEGVGGPGIDDANTLGMHLATGLMFAAFLVILARGWMRWLAVLLIPLIVNGIIQTETRGALVGLFLGSLATIYLKPKRFRRVYYSLAALAVVGFVVIANETFIDRMQSMIAAVDKEQEWDSSAASRVEIVKSQIEIFKDYPFGVGHQGTAYLSPQYIEEKWLAVGTGTRASHNTVMSILVDQGLPGIILFTLLSITVVNQLRRLKKADTANLSDSFGLYRAMLGGTIVSVFGAGLFAQNLKAEILVWTLALIAVLVELGRRQLIERETEKYNGAQSFLSV